MRKQKNDHVAFSFSSLCAKHIWTTESTEALRATQRNQIIIKMNEMLRLKGNKLRYFWVPSFFSSVVRKNSFNHKEDKRRFTEEKVKKMILWFPHSLLIQFSMCKTYLNHREHRGAARYTEKSKRYYHFLILFSFTSLCANVLA